MSFCYVLPPPPCAHRLELYTLFLLAVVQTCEEILRVIRATVDWLKRELDMDSFLDDEIWRSADDILKVIDKKSCWKEDRGVYDYNERNLTTSYVHVMLCNAIMQAMNSCDFVFFFEYSQFNRSIFCLGKTKNIFPMVIL